MDDGVSWSGQADFTARLADWDNESDPMWLLQRAERAALVDLNVPHFTTTSDGHTLRDAWGTSITPRSRRVSSVPRPGCAASTTTKSLGRWR